jgi:hypothetical protein
MAHEPQRRVGLERQISPVALLFPGATLSLAVFWLALETRLSDEEAGALVAKCSADDPA